MRAGGPTEPVAFHFPGDDLFAPLLRPHGLPIGNLTSQIWANAVLTPVDHLLGSGLGLGSFVRYCDDVLVYAEDRSRLEDAWRRVRDLADRLRLRLHPDKCRLHRTTERVGFVEFVLERHGGRVAVHLRRSNILAFRRRMAKLRGERHPERFFVGVRAWLAHARHGHTRGLCRAELSRLVWTQ